MPYDSNGNFTLNAGYLAIAGQTIQPSQHNPVLEDIGLSGLSNVVVRDGRAAMTGNLNMGAFRVRNIADGTLSTDAVSKGQLDAQATTQSAANRGYIYGLTLSNNAVDATNDIDIASGAAAQDTATTPAVMVLAASLTKRLDANWTVGTNQGGLDTGSKANNTGYHIWLIQRSDTGVVDALFSLSGTSPTMPTNYDRKVKIGCVITDGAGAIRPFTQYGDRFVLTSTFVAINLSGGSGGNITNNTLTLPTGVRYDVEVAGSVTSASAWAFFLYTPGVTPDVQDLVARGGAGGVSSIGVARILSNTSSQITTAGSVASMTITLALRAWTYPRGV